MSVVLFSVNIIAGNSGAIAGRLHLPGTSWLGASWMVHDKHREG